MTESQILRAERRQLASAILSAESRAARVLARIERYQARAVEIEARLAELDAPPSFSVQTADPLPPA